MAGEISVTIRGMDELAKTFQKLSMRYPDEVGKLLKKRAYKFRNDLVHEVKGAVETHPENKRSLGITKSYDVSKVKGVGISQYVEVSANAPHFHLVDSGHVLTTHKKQGKRPIGFVPGRLMKEAAVKRLEENMPVVVEYMVDKLLKEGGLR